jgi:hypothetical protein
MSPSKSNRTVNRITLAVLLFLLIPHILPAQTNQTKPATDDYSSVPPLNVAQKFNYRVIQAFGPRGLLDAGLGAALDQARNEPREWGGGARAFGERFGSSFGAHLSSQSMEFILESALHEDPRYFPSSQKAFGARMKHALLATVVTRTDSGTQRIAVAKIASAFGTGQLVNVWQPPSTGSAGDGLKRTGFIFAEHAAWNVAQEFIPRLRAKSLRP